MKRNFSKASKAEAQPGLRIPLRFCSGSLSSVFILFAVVAVLAILWPELARDEFQAIFASGDWVANMDWLLFFLGIFFFVCVALSPARDDLTIVLAGLIGGTIIEVWGTRTNMWHYYTLERPPLWILPAWGISALCNEKLQRASLACMPARWREEVITGEKGSKGLKVFYWAMFLPLFLFYVWWSWPSFFHPFTCVVTVLLFLSILPGRFPAYALSLFFSGAFLGVFLEIWGTTRTCWNYYDGKAPSPFPIAGHGLAALAFWKLKTLLRHYLPFFRSWR
jgi:hypothetical protein